MSQVLGGIRVTSIIWSVSILTLSSLYICYNSTDISDPSIMDSAMVYPYTIIFRVCMMYSLFLYFMLFLFIKWWLDSSQIAKQTKVIVVCSTIGLLSYGLFVACIDRKRINYPLAKKGVFYASIGISTAICLTMHQLNRIRKQTPLFIGETSFNLKRITSLSQGISMTIAILIAFGQIDVVYRNRVQYWVVISTILFLWTFVLDFKRFKMDVDRIPKKTQIAQITQQTLNSVNSLNQNVFVNQQPYYGQPVVYNTVQMMPNQQYYH